MEDIKAPESKTIPLGKDGIPNPAVQEQFTEGPQQPKELTQEETQQLLENRLPLMRLQDEYNKLVIAAYEQDFLQGRIQANQIPGLLGIELMVRDIQAQGFLMQWKAGQEAAMQRHEQEKKMKEEFDKLSPEDQQKWLEEKEQRESRNIDRQQTAQ